MQNLLARLCIKLLRSKKLKGENKTLILNALLDNIGALPIKKIITFDVEGAMLINGKRLEIEQAISLKQSAQAFRDNTFRKLVEEQIAYMAVEYAIHNGLSPETIMFSKVAFWIQEEVKKLHTLVASEQ